MPEYLAPGVYVEETSFRSKSIQGVPTSTTGFAGLAHYGPVYFPDGPSSCEPRLVTSYIEFERVYGGLEELEVDGGRPAYLAHAVRAFFENGGQRLYVSRVFVPDTSGAEPDRGVASHTVAVAGVGPDATWWARWPGKAGEVVVEVDVNRTKNVAYDDGGVVQARQVRDGAVVEVIPPGTDPPSGDADLDPDQLHVVHVRSDGRQEFRRNGAAAAVAAGSVIQLVELTVRVRVSQERVDEYGALATHPDQKRYIGRILDPHDPEDENAVIWLEWDAESAAGDDPDAPALLMAALANASGQRLAGGNDGVLPTPNDLRGEEAPPDDPDVKATGLEALGEIDDIAIVALPDAGDLGGADLSLQAANFLVSHAERNRFRIAVLDGPQGSSMNEIREFRSQIDSRYAALYHPWLEILDPTERAAQGAPPRKLLLPPSGFVTGIYARSDIERGVHKAPANEVIRGITRLESNITRGRQEVLNPEGINALRFFEGRAHRVWGARTVSSDPEWMYVNVRRLFIYIEHSIYKGTQWAVFEPNNRHLWANIRQTVENFLLDLWMQGALLGAKPEEAYFVRCDRTTMTQHDLDNGRMVCLVGVAPTKPAEFVIFRIGQWTADAKNN